MTRALRNAYVCVYWFGTIRKGFCDRSRLSKKKRFKHGEVHTVGSLFPFPLIILLFILRLLPSPKSENLLFLTHYYN